MHKKNKFEFIEHPQITTDYLWNDGIHFQDTGKSLLCQNFINRVSRFFFFFDESSLPGDHSIELETSTKASTVIISLYIGINFFEPL